MIAILVWLIAFYQQNMEYEMFHRGNNDQFMQWNNEVNQSLEISIEGKVNYNAASGLPDPERQKTISYSTKIEHPAIEDDYIWEYGEYQNNEIEIISMAQALNAGFISAE